MRVAIVSDIHGNLPALQAVVADAGTVDAWWNLGDIVSGPLWPAETADYLMARGWPTLAGNHERQLLRGRPERMGASDRHARERLDAAQRAWLESLPPELRPLDGVWCLHGCPQSDIDGLLETVTPAGMRPATPGEVDERLAARRGERLVLCGHTHLPRCIVLGGTTVLNPGSVGLQAYLHDRPFDHEVANGTPDARYAIVEITTEGIAVDLRVVPYDHERAAARAAEAGFADWAHALRTGRNLPAAH